MRILAATKICFISFFLVVALIGCCRGSKENFQGIVQKFKEFDNASGEEMAVIIALDTSYSMNGYMKHLKTSAYSLSNVIPKTTIISFSDESKILCEGCNSEESFESIINLQIGESTNLTGCLRDSSEVFNRQCHSQNCNKILIIFSDGYPFDSKQSIVEASKMKKEGVLIYTISAGERIDLSFLEELGTSKKTQVMESSFENLEKQVKYELKDSVDLYPSPKPSIIDIDLELFKHPIKENYLGCKITVISVDGSFLRKGEVFRVVDNMGYFYSYAFYSLFDLDFREKSDGKGRSEFSVNINECLNVIRTSTMMNKLLSIPRYIEIIPKSGNVKIRKNRFPFDVSKFENIIFKNVGRLGFEKDLVRDNLTILVYGEPKTGKSEDLNALATLCLGKYSRPFRTSKNGEIGTEEITKFSISGKDSPCGNLEIIDVFGIKNITQEHLNYLINGMIPIGTKKSAFDESKGEFNIQPVGKYSQFKPDVIWWYIMEEKVEDYKSLAATSSKLFATSDCVGFIPILQCHSTIECKQELFEYAVMQQFSYALDSMHVHTSYPYVHDAFGTSEVDPVRNSHYFVRLALSIHRKHQERISSICSTNQFSDFIPHWIFVYLYIGLIVVSGILEIIVAILLVLRGMGYKRYPYEYDNSVGEEFERLEREGKKKN